jgi:FkbM family methyltransferase
LKRSADIFIRFDQPGAIMNLHRRLTVRFDLWELILGLSLVAMATALVWARKSEPANPVQSERELQAFGEKYGPGHYSEREEEWLIRDFFQDRRGGVFVDVGANHYRLASKTYYLEKNLGWSGLAIEPQQQYAADYSTHRPRTKFFPFFVSDVSNETAKLYVLKDSPLVASSDPDFVRQFGKPDEVRDVPTISLTDLLVREGLQTIDFLSMDIELHEPQALKGFDINRFKPALVCIEALEPVRQQILDFFTEHDYVVVGKYVWVDRENLYFMPLGSRPASP